MVVRTSATLASIESLDSRRLLSAAMSGTQLIVTGTADADHVLIHVDSADATNLLVNVNGEETSFPTNGITGIAVVLGSGADHAIVDEHGQTIHLPVTMFGGGGSDLLIGGSGDDQLFGGAGRDRLIGMDGNDLISGGGSRDKMAGGDGSDTLLGGSGDDAIDAGTGEDLVSGGFGDDYIDGGTDADLLIGGSDFDTLLGGTGDDGIAGGKGDDDIDGGFGDDALAGGGGDDVFARDDAGNSDLIADKTDGSDREYTPVTLDFVPEQYRNLFNDTFPNSDPVGVRVNDDHSFVLLYRYNGDGTVYHAWFKFMGDHPFDNFDGVSLSSYEVAPANLPPITRAAFFEAHPNAIIKEVIAEHVGAAKYAVIRIMENGAGESKWVAADWLDNE
jgi:hypothetical protein